jgi:uncharacterized membrane protein
MIKKVSNPKILPTDTSLEENHDPKGLERLIFFSDAVFAIAITLLILEIQLPTQNSSLTDAELFQSILAIAPKYAAYIISFLVIGLIWVSHHRKFRLIQKYDGYLILINLFLLMTIAFIPFPTSLLSMYGNRTATIFYAIIMILASLWSAGLWWYASFKNRLIDPHLDQRLRRRETLGPVLSIGVFMLSIGLAFIDNNLARLSWTLLAITPRLSK